MAGRILALVRSYWPYFFSHSSSKQSRLPEVFIAFVRTFSLVELPATCSDCRRRNSQSRRLSYGRARACRHGLARFEPVLPADLWHGRRSNSSACAIYANSFALVTLIFVMSKLLKFKSCAANCHPQPRLLHQHRATPSMISLLRGDHLIRLPSLLGPKRRLARADIIARKRNRL